MSRADGRSCEDTVLGRRSEDGRAYWLHKEIYMYFRPHCGRKGSRIGIPALFLLITLSVRFPPEYILL